MIGTASIIAEHRVENRGNLPAQLARRIGGIHFGRSRIVFTQPVPQRLLGAVNDRVNFPERVVEIDRDRADVFHGLRAAA